jgi:dolichol-phosphate mannosyltransferase
VSALTPAPLKLSILLPVRGEGVNLQIMVRILTACLDIPYEVLVIYDDPTDGSISTLDSFRVSHANVRGIHNSLGRGVINAIRAGVAEARGEYVLIFAADEIGPVLAIGDMIALMDDGCDLVSCTRYAHGGRRLGGSWVGGLLSRTANRLFRVLSGSVMTDCTTGIKMFRRTVFAQLHLEASPVGWAVTFEMALKAQVMGLRLGEVPIISIDRLFGGTSTFRLGPWLKEYLRWFIWGVREIRKSPGASHRRVSVRIPAATAS